MTGRVALVTGVTGQDGSYLAERLLADGWQVHGMVRPGGHDQDEQPVTAGVMTHEGDLRDPGVWEPLLERVGPDVVFHLAGLTSVGRSWADPLLAAETTGMAPVRLFAAAQRLHDQGVPIRLVQASSAEIFAGCDVTPQDERTPVMPVSPYGAAKAYAHLAARVHRTRGLPVSCAVLYNHESPRRPPSFVTRKITMGVADIVRGRADVLTLGNLAARRDWSWAPDVVDALVRIAEHPEADEFVVATGTSHSVGEFVTAAFRAAGIDDERPYVRIDPELVRPADGADLRGDPAKAREVLGWRPTVGFDELVARLVEAELAGGEQDASGQPRPSSSSR